METYTIISGNIGAVDAWLAHPLKGPNWTTTADVDEEGKVGETHVIVCPEIGPNLGKLPITPNLRSEVQRLIQKHRDRPAATASPQFGSDLAQYSGTTGNQRVASLLKAYQTNQWLLSCAPFKGMPEDHVQLVDGETVIADVPVEPLATLHARVGHAIGLYHSRKYSTSGTPQPLICVRNMPTGSWLVSLWLGGVELEGNADEWFGASRNPAGYRDMLERIERWRAAHGARIESDVDLDEIRRRVTEQPAENGQAGPAGNDAPPADRETGERLMRLPLDQIVMGPNQRSHYNHEKLLELADSIREVGVREPVLVTLRDGRYLLTAGHRRVLASKMANVPDIIAVVREQAKVDDEIDQLIENIQRVDISPIDEARAYKRLLQCDGLDTPAKVAGRVGKSRVQVVEHLQLLELPSELQEQVATGALAVKAGLEFLRRTKEAPEPVRAQVAKTLADEKPSVREAGKVIDRELDKAGVARATPRPETPPAASVVPPAPPQPATASSVPPAPVPEPAPAPPAPAAAPPSTAEMAGMADTVLRQIGARYWPAPPDGMDVTLDIGASMSVAEILDSWAARLTVTPGYIPRGMGNVEVNIPEQLMWFKGKETNAVKPLGQYKPEELAIVVGGAGVTVQCANGRVEVGATWTQPYYRVAIYGGKLIRQQVVLYDGVRHIVVTGTDNLTITQDKVRGLVEILRKLPAE